MTVSFYLQLLASEPLVGALKLPGCVLCGRTMPLPSEPWLPAIAGMHARHNQLERRRCMSDCCQLTCYFHARSVVAVLLLCSLLHLARCVHTSSKPHLPPEPPYMLVRACCPVIFSSPGICHRK